MRVRVWLPIALIAFVAALGGVLLGQRLVKPSPGGGSELHDILHKELVLDDRQHAALTALEQRFATRRRDLENHMRDGNVHLAAAIQAEHGDGPQVRKAIDEIHEAMGALQKETVAHVFAMRRVLRVDQTAAFDRAVTHALTRTPNDDR